MVSQKTTLPSLGQKFIKQPSAAVLPKDLPELPPDTRQVLSLRKYKIDSSSFDVALTVSKSKCVFKFKRPHHQTQQIEMFNK